MQAKELAEKSKYDSVPGWKRAMFEKRDAKAAENAKPQKEIDRRRIEVERMFDDLPGWQRENAIKKEKKRILQEEGIIL